MEISTSPLRFCASRAKSTARMGLGHFIVTQERKCGQAKLKRGFDECSVDRKASKINLGDSSHLAVGTTLQMAIPKQVIKSPFKVSRNRVVFRI